MNFTPDDTVNIDTAVGGTFERGLFASMLDVLKAGSNAVAKQPKLSNVNHVLRKLFL